MACDVVKPFRSARPRPVLGLFHHSGAHRIPLNVSQNLIKLLLIPHPAVIRFRLPEGLTASTQYPIGLAAAGALQSTHDLRQFFMRLQQQVDMVRHDDPGVEVEESQLLAARKQCVPHDRGYLRILQPGWTRRRAIHLAVKRHESLPFGVRRVFEKFRMARQRAVQPPGDKEGRVFRVPVR